MGDLIDAVKSAELWQLAILLVAIVAGSSGLSALINSAFSSRTSSRDFRRQIRAQALEVVGTSYALYQFYGNAPATPIDPDRDQKVANASSALLVGVAQIGDVSLLSLARELVKQGELFAGQNEETSADDIDRRFALMVEEISKGVPA
ncbi:hypothetical protein ITJ57_08275 [Plantibacter sp. VKM Ac-2880]|uniref:hypothetical protein n=1 Tax=Plantibacter sp. VKM Ac-2880 TaxID=2783827 RepID=UPI00188FAF26|nr:hypothetical protein [Plantibacter sp. VKM Ac-2880]MBF4568766.1 hypothetical protein [Plantibacter sp. VKM Ac-2880]